MEIPESTFKREGSTSNQAIKEDTNKSLEQKKMGDKRQSV
jgi:hypothetical protein